MTGAPTLADYPILILRANARNVVRKRLVKPRRPPSQARRHQDDRGVFALAANQLTEVLMKSLALTLSGAVFGAMALVTAAPAGAGDDPAQSASRLDVIAMGSSAQAVPLTDLEMSGMRGTGFISALISNLLAVLPQQNTVFAQVGNSAPVTNSGTGPQTFTLTTSSVHINLLATSVPPPGS